MAIHALPSTHNLDAVTQARIDLAAAHRLSVLHELDEGIDNHFTVTVPGETDRYLILPFGMHWSEAQASTLIMFDSAGATVEGEGVVELSAHCIHEPIHRITGAQVVLHTHQTWALALNMLHENRLLAASQTAAYFQGRVAYDDVYEGTADTSEEGERLAHILKPEHHTVFMKNHGVLVLGDNMAQAYRRLYLLERVCRAQVLAMSTGRELSLLSDAIVEQVQSPAEDDVFGREKREHMFFDAMKRVLDRDSTAYLN